MFNENNGIYPQLNFFNPVFFLDRALTGKGQEFDQMFVNEAAVVFMKRLTAFYPVDVINAFQLIELH
jgi:hypothetical protein